MIKLFRYLRPFALSVIIVLILVFLQSLVELYLPTLMADIVNRGIVQGDTDYILRIGGFMVLIAAGGAVCSILAGYISAKIATGYSKNLRSSVFSRVQSYSLREFNELGTASLITRTTNDITQVQQLLIFLMRMTISAPMMFIGGIIMAVSKDASLSLVFVVVLPLLSGTVYLIAGKSIPLFKTMQVKLDNLNRVFREGLTGIRVIRAFNRIAHEKKRFSTANLDLTQTAIKVNILMAALMPVMMLVMNFTTLAIVWFGGIRISHGNMLVGDMMAFIQYAMLIMFSLVMVSFMFIMIPRAEASAVRINEVLEIVPEISDAEAVRSTESNRGLIEFKNVTFCYPGAEYPALKDISFTARPGEITAIIGGTGSGKSTLINLIPRFYDIDSGQVLVNGLDVREMAQKDLRAKIGFVPQKTMLFTGTVADNIRLGKEDATEEEIRHAAEIAQATEFIAEMPDGFASLIAQGGQNISGGQKQRLSIARALVHKPEIYIFDDSFSALDYKTDARLRAALRKETADATVIVVGQRVSTVMDADQIIVLDKGQIVGMGKHKELMQTCEVYREIVSSQLSEEEIA
jgi:ATP-binding cassette subfamily B multidrug efflux pump